jgi:hypothetical protein
MDIVTDLASEAIYYAEALGWRVPSRWARPPIVSQWWGQWPR